MISAGGPGISLLPPNPQCCLQSGEPPLRGSPMPLDTLREFLRCNGLERHTQAVEAWCQDMGAAFLEEVFQNSKEIAQALKFTEEEQERFSVATQAATVMTSLGAMASFGQPQPQGTEQQTNISCLLADAAMARLAACPLCNSENGFGLRQSVSIAAQHEGWGLKWNECHYNCQVCKRLIARESIVDCCRDCRVFWHKDCNKAIVEDAVRAQCAQRALQWRPATRVSVRKTRATHVVEPTRSSNAKGKKGKRLLGSSCRTQTSSSMPNQATKASTASTATPAATIHRTTSLNVPGASAQNVIPLDRAMTVFTTPSEKAAAAQRAAKASIPLRAWDFRRLPRQKVRVRNAERTQDGPSEAEVLDEEVEPLPGQLDRAIILARQKRHRLRGGYRDYVRDSELLHRRIPHAQELQHPFTAEIERAQEELQQSNADAQPRTFENVRQLFMREHGPEIKHNLHDVFKGKVTLTPAPVAPAVQKQFLQSYSNCLPCGSSLLPTYHGSNRKNYPSICERGLLIPGRGNELKIEHGAAHGRGIYTAQVRAPDLSRGFCTHPDLLVCGVIDDAQAGIPWQCGNHTVSAQSNSIRHVGDAVVIFDQSRVVPLFRASAEDWGQYRWSWQPSGGGQKTMTVNTWLGGKAPGVSSGVASLNVAKPNSNQVFVDAGKGKVYHAPSKQLAFLPPQPKDASSYEINQKRILEKKLRDQARHYQRREKQDKLGMGQA